MPCTHPLLYVRDAQDACVVLEAVRQEILPLWTRRLNPIERQNIQPGNIFVWEEAEEKGGLERWTDGRRWTQSRMRLDFLFYEETLPPTDEEKTSKRGSFESSSRRQERPLKPNGLAKQTISMLVNDRGHERRWHLVAYTSLDDRRYPVPLIDQYDYLRRLKVPDGVFLTTRGYPWTKRPIERTTSPNYAPQPAYTPSPYGSAPSSPPSLQMAKAYQHSMATSSRGQTLYSLKTDMPPKDASGQSSGQWTPLTPEDRRALESFPLRL